MFSCFIVLSTKYLSNIILEKEKAGNPAFLDAI